MLSQSTSHFPFNTVLAMSDRIDLARMLSVGVLAAQSQFCRFLKDRLLVEVD